jgi:orotidine-5'-phosphate decarboxylase
VFLDLKYHDIPSTVANAVESAAQLDVELVTLHASGGEAMMRAARQAVGDDGPRLLGVTILTSFTAVDVEQVWNKEILSVRDEVARLAHLAVDAGLHGVVTSPLEVESLKRRHGAGFIVVTPGIRPSGDGLGDQARTATPAEAARAGSDFLVVGRPVLTADDPLAVVHAMRAELEDVRVVQ